MIASSSQKLCCPSVAKRIAAPATQSASNGPRPASPPTDRPAQPNRLALPPYGVRASSAPDVSTRRVGFELGPAETIRERPKVGAGRRLDDVRRDALTRGRPAVELDHHRHLAERVLALGHRVDPELPQARVDADRRVQRVEDRVDRAVAR